ncbi:hypothetical protein CN440_26740 [Bacillus cereus]|nr:hypothetical protein CN440_26740 [Bacillus cereus]
MSLNKNERIIECIILVYERDVSGNIAVWCPYCVTWHLHGQRDRHRSAQYHNRRRPFIEIGYIIKNVGFFMNVIILFCSYC